MIILIRRVDGHVHRSEESKLFVECDVLVAIIIDLNRYAATCFLNLVNFSNLAFEVCN